MRFDHPPSLWTRPCFPTRVSRWRPLPLRPRVVSLRYVLAKNYGHFAYATIQAQQMAAHHAADEPVHNPSIEDVEDETDIGHSHTLDNMAVQDAQPSNGQSIPSSAKGKAKAVDPATVPQTNGRPAAKPINMQSEEAFPSLGPRKGDPLAGATVWGAKPASLSTPGRTSTPTAGRPTNMPSRNVRHSITIRKDEFKPATELRKPLVDIIRNHNKRTKAPVKATSSVAGMTFSAEGPNMDLVNQSLKEIANEVCAKVSFLYRGCSRRSPRLLFESTRSRTVSLSPFPHCHPSSANKGRAYRKFSVTVVPV